MFNVLSAIKDGTLEYGKAMECDKILQDWVKSSPLSDASTGNPKAKDGRFLLIADGHKLSLPKNTDVSQMSLKSFLNDFQKPLQKEWSQTSWLEASTSMMIMGKQMNEANNKKLLGLALSTTLGRSLRYCIQYEIEPATKYWNHYAHQLMEINNNDKASKRTVVVLVDSSCPVLSVCRSICPLLSKGMDLVLVPGNETLALPCLILAELINKAGFICSFYEASLEQVKEIAAVENTTVVVCGGQNVARSLRHSASNLKLDLDGKKAIVVMETGDCDAAVDAALFALKSSSASTGPGLYFLVQDSERDEIIWRLRERFEKCRSGDWLDKMTDFPDHQRFEAPKEVSDYFNDTRLDVIKKGNARMLINAQPSLPITQWKRLGQTLLVLSFRTTTELISLLGNLAGLSELSLWVEHQAVAWQVVSHIQVSRVWINGFGNYEPGFDQLVDMQNGQALPETVTDGKTNSSLHATVDGLRTVQKSWAVQSDKSLIMIKLLKQLLGQDPFFAKTELLLDLIRIVHNAKGKVVDSGKNSLTFNLSDPLGAIAVIASEGDQLDCLVRVVTLALLHGNAVMLSTSAALNSAAQNFIKAAKEAGLPNVVATCPLNEENNRALLKNHGLRKMILIGPVQLPAITESHLKPIWRLQNGSDVSTQEITNALTLNKWVWMPIGDGLGN